MKSRGKTMEMNHLWKIFWRVTIFLFKYFTTQNLHLEFLLLRTSVSTWCIDSLTDEGRRFTWSGQKDNAQLNIAMNYNALI